MGGDQRGTLGTGSPLASARCWPAGQRNSGLLRQHGLVAPLGSTMLAFDQKTLSGLEPDHRTRASWEASMSLDHAAIAGILPFFFIFPLHIKSPKLPAQGSTFIRAERQPDILVDVSRLYEILLPLCPLLLVQCPTWYMWVGAQEMVVA